jgi:hypothetical protein
MKKAAMKGSTPRYRIEGVKGQYYDVFSKRANAIKAAIEMAVEYPGTTFLVVRTTLVSRKVIFKYKVEIEFNFNDLQDVYRGIVEVYQERLNKTKYWRKPDVT